MALETIRCIEEGVVRSTAEANVGSILGIGFPPLHGGAVQYVNAYQASSGAGPSAFLDRAAELCDRYGDRFAPPQLLVNAVDAGTRL
jgi:3-hydroxyacyl-CoA dehydrogenase/enoyl-CoA hydratase/3-hydroxybutyryl-CoA epimerase